MTDRPGARTAPRAGLRPGLRAGLRVLGWLTVWLAVALPVWVLLFTHSSATTVLASHDAVLRPTLDARVRLDLGPYLPDVRFDSGSRVGVVAQLDGTSARTTPELVQRYASIVAQPRAEAERTSAVVTGLALRSAAWAALAGLVPPGVWALVGRGRRAELASRRTTAVGVVAATLGLAVVVGLLATRPWERPAEAVRAEEWLPVQDALPGVTVPPDLRGWQVQGGLVTAGTQRLVASLFDTYDRSKLFYAGVAGRIAEVADQLHAPGAEETVAVLVSDRHDNIGMDAVARRVADEAGATVVLDAGDDTSTGDTWEQFSLDSLDSAFGGYDARVAVAGNHDHGTFVSRHLTELGWTHLTGAPVQPFADVRVLGVDDPRSSGLGTWRDESGLSFAEVRARITEDLCRLDEQDERVATLLVHDAKLGATALARGCTDLVLAGHLHAQVGPDRVQGENDRVGYSYTNGTTGGAAYAVAVGSKLRRPAQLTLVTYAAGRPVGLQPVTVATTGALEVAAYSPLDLG